MKYEIDLFGVLVPSLLVWVVAAYLILVVLRGLFKPWAFTAMSGIARSSTSPSMSACSAASFTS